MPSTKKPTESPLAFPHKGSMGTTEPLLAVGNIPEVVEPLQGYKQIKADHEFLRDCSLESCSVGVGNRWLPSRSPAQDCQTGRGSQRGRQKPHCLTLTLICLNASKHGAHRHTDGSTTSSFGLAPSAAKSPTWKNSGGKTKTTQRGIRPFLTPGLHTVPRLLLPAASEQRRSSASRGWSRYFSAS